tara:strand:- start:5570 stop:6220 length:651 start_codon:yes stop_codon:yes gene_type:complete
VNISKFLLIDSALSLAAIPLIFFLQGVKRKSIILQNSNKEKLLKDISTKIPSKRKLIELEKLSIKNGSGIEFNSLLGNWKFVSVWKRNKEDEDTVLSSLLKVFSANMRIKEEFSTKNSPRFRLIISIQFGLFTIEFSGSGYLKGKQPLLEFFLDVIELKSGTNILLSKSIAKLEEEEKSFFALISLEENGHWLSARGQGGAVVIWLKDCFNNQSRS